LLRTPQAPISFSLPIGGSDIVTLASVQRGYSQTSETEGLVYVPTLPASDPCSAQVAKYAPKNVTTLSSLPNNEDFLITVGLVALIPWISGSCMQSFFNLFDNMPSNELYGIVTYLPQDIALGNFPQAEPPASSSSAWNIDGNLDWQVNMNMPVYAINADHAQVIMTQLSLYSGNMTQAPHAANLTKIYDPHDYVRLYSLIDQPQGTNLPSLWVFLLIVLGVLLFLICSTSFCMHTMQRYRRRAIQRSVVEGEMDLEALGIKRLTVPAEVLDKMALIVYVAPEDSVEKSAVPAIGPASPPKSAIAPRVSVSSGSKEEPPDHERGDHITAANDGDSPSSSIDEIPKPTTTVDVAEQAHLPPISSLPHQHLAFTQPTCSICLEDFVSRGTIVRPLPCKHVFHPSCINPVLREYSSLCPICKASVLPAGYCPEITNAMIRRIRGLQRLRELEARRNGTSTTVVGRTMRFFAWRERAAQDVQLSHVMRPGERARAAATAAQLYAGARTQTSAEGTAEPATIPTLNLPTSSPTPPSTQTPPPPPQAQPQLSTERPAYSRTASAQSTSQHFLAPNVTSAPITETRSTDGAQARPAHVSREEWARRRAEGMLQQPISAAEANRREERQRPACKFPVLKSSPGRVRLMK
jgi:Ring finger domain